MSHIHLTGVLDVSGEAVLVLSKVLQGCHGVRAPDVKHEFDSARQLHVTRVCLADPRVLVRPVGHVKHVRRGLQHKHSIALSCLQTTSRALPLD